MFKAVSIDALRYRTNADARKDKGPDACAPSPLNLLVGRAGIEPATKRLGVNRPEPHTSDAQDGDDSPRQTMERVEAIEFATLESVHWFNQRRFLEPIGNAPPVELEASYYESTGQLPMAA